MTLRLPAPPHSSEPLELQRVITALTADNRLQAEMIRGLEKRLKALESIAPRAEQGGEQ